VRLLVVLPMLASLVGCGPIQSTASLIDAEVALEAARAAGAKNAAPFEYTGAEAYLHKSREVSGRARYEESATFAARAIALAKDAREKALAASARDEVAP
jgi:hypothetical protein